MLIILGEIEHMKDYQYNWFRTLQANSRNYDEGTTIRMHSSNDVCTKIVADDTGQTDRLTQLLAKEILLLQQYIRSTE